MQFRWTVWCLGLIWSSVTLSTEWTTCWAAGISETQTKPSHKQVKVIRPIFNDRQLNLNTFAIAPNGELWMCCTNLTGEVDKEAAEEYAKVLSNTSLSRAGDESCLNFKPEGRGRILVFQTNGDFIRSHWLDFAPQAINFSQRGTVFVAGSGKIARMNERGKLELVMDAPNLATDEQAIELQKKEQEQQIEKMRLANDQRSERLKQQIEKLEEQLADETKDASRDERKIQRSEKRLAILKSTLEQQDAAFESMREELESSILTIGDKTRLMRATGLSVSDKDIFVSLPAQTGYAYDIYRMSHDLSEPVIVKKGISGCCGQLDIQCDGDDLVIAENCAFKVAKYDRSGKALSSFGDRAQALSDPKENIKGWGSCCNPMNVRCMSNGEVLVAESSIGNIKRYNSNGEFIGIVGTAKIGAGCKHVAVAKDSRHDWYFMMNSNANSVAVLVPLSEAPAETEDERESRLAMQGLGQKLLGGWKFDKRIDKDNQTNLNVVGDANNFDFGKMLISSNEFLKLSSDGTASRTQTVSKTDVDASKTTKPSPGLLGALSQLLGGSSTDVATSENDALKWNAIKQEGDVIQFSLRDENGVSFAAAVRFIDDSKAEFKIYYDEIVGEPQAVAHYIKVEQCDDKCSKVETSNQPKP